MESIIERWFATLDKNGLVWLSDVILYLIAAIFIYRHFISPLLKSAKKINKYIPILISMAEEFHSEDNRSIRDIVDNIYHGQSKLQTQIYDISSSVNIGFYEADANGNYLNINNQWCVITGLLPSESYGTSWIRSIMNDDRDRIWREWRDAIEQRRDFTSEYSVHRKNGEILRVRNNAHVIKNSSGTVSGFVGSVVQLP